MSSSNETNVQAQPQPRRTDVPGAVAAVLAPLRGRDGAVVISVEALDMVQRLAEQTAEVAAPEWAEVFTRIAEYCAYQLNRYRRWQIEVTETLPRVVTGEAEPVPAGTGVSEEAEFNDAMNRLRGSIERSKGEER